MKRLCSALALLCLLPPTARSEEAHGAWIVARPSAGMVTLEAYGKLDDQAAGRYELRAVKTGSSGQSTSRQTGLVPVSVEDQEPKPLAISKVSVEEGATLNVTLVVTGPNGEVYEASFIYPGE